MGFPEADHSEVTIEKILAQYNILPLLPLNNRVFLQDGAMTSFSLAEALDLTRGSLLGVPLTILSRLEYEVIRRLGERKEARSKIKRRFEAEREGLLTRGPGRILAAIAVNADRGAKWTKEGLIGNEGWERSSQEEAQWWGWVYNQKQNGVNVEEWWVEDTGNLLRAVFIMRARLKANLITRQDFGSFIETITPFVPDPEVNPSTKRHLEKIAKT